MAEQVLVVIIGVFLLWLIVRLVLGYVSSRAVGLDESNVPKDADNELAELVGQAVGGKTREVLRAIHRRAQGMGSSQMRAAHYCASGNLAISELKRPNLAAGLYLRSLREDPTCVEALVHLQQILVAQKRIRRLERTYWDILARLDDPEESMPMWEKCWTGLASLYSASPRTVRRADAIRKSLQAFGISTEEES